jgi:acyl carrier protein
LSYDLENKVIRIIAQTLAVANNASSESIQLSRDSKMNDPKEWDSLSFVAVMIAISEEFDLQVEDDDAINFTSVQAIVEMIS